MLVLPAPAHATSITGVLDFTFSGSSPSGDPTVTADDGGVPGSVELTFDLTDLSPTEFADDFYLNFNPAKDETALSFTQLTGPLVNSVEVEENEKKADGDGFYDILFDWPPPPGGDPTILFSAGDTASFLVTGLADLVATDFAFFSVCTRGDCGAGFTPLPHTSRALAQRGHSAGGLGPIRI